MTLDARFDHAAEEPRLYAGWEASGAFAADPGSVKPHFAIMIPPPNVTGVLHVGHALTMTLQDVLARCKRMQGFDVLWQPGTDHAGIATQMVVERELAAAQLPGRVALGRAAFTDKVWAWKAQSGGAISAQLRRLGASLDWSRERFTMDPGLADAVRDIFVRLYDDGLIYRDTRLVNWDAKLGTAISDLEVEQQDVRGSLWHIRYPLQDDPSQWLTVATTRPETLLGDMAVAIHPENERLRHWIGKRVVLPLTGRTIPVIADTHADPGKGTGAVKITPAHDFDDNEVGRRHSLGMPSILDREARITFAEIVALPREDDLVFAQSRVAFDGLSAMTSGAKLSDARKKISAALSSQYFAEDLPFLEKVEPHAHGVPHGDRSGVVIEPLLTLQWYVRSEALAEPASRAVETGATRFVPKQWENTFFAWMRGIEPWCISRQIWWGHRIPAWYAPDGSVFVARDAAQAQALAGPGTALTQDEDVLDTWFSSALWPFSTQGWPERTPELAAYYPGAVLVTGFDIIFFWVARMMMFGLYTQGEVPFRDVYIHGLVRDERGQKMSKSKGNVIDPLALIDAFGTDALRFAVCDLAGPGRDIALGRARVETSRAFVTKLWNAARFCEINGVVPVADFVAADARTPLARWLLDALNRTIGEATAALDAYRFDEYAAACYRFTWGTFCDWFVEFSKPVLTGDDAAAAAEIRATGAYVLGQILRLLHPVMPFVTEALSGHFGFTPACALITAAWPVPVTVREPEAARAELDWVVRLVSEVRAVRGAVNVPPSAKMPLYLRGASDASLARARDWEGVIVRLARLDTVSVPPGTVPKGVAQAVLDEATLMLPLAGFIDLSAERARLQKDRARTEGEVAKVLQKLGNADFVARAPADIVAENHERLSTFRAEIERLDAALRWLDA